MPFDHAFVDHDAPSLTLIDASGTRYHFPGPQVRICNDFNRHLREHGTRDGFLLGIPGGYNDLAELWNADENVSHRFAGYDADTDTVTIRGSILPAALIDEIDPPAVAPAPTLVAAEPQFTPHQTETISRMLWVSAEREARFHEARGAARNKKVDDRKRKRDEHRASDAAASGSGKKTRPVERDGGRAEDAVAGGSKSKSSKKAKPSTSHQDEPMQEDADAEGEPEKPEDELIGYTDDEEQEMSKAEGKKRAGGSKRA
ncbi:hypothetical protein K466DRAFT_504960 [Polyporus arcularius HHB13444]|uniref:Uncharacterized protein n=1 Tax=Polyporus arcularius HHB13444 TaxID=1314778 RepID=A0A5C3NTB7_9APHY|nr:hypothetical protein K466DRAFT_504960 [Polyporus arcularius HHB13444]